MINWVGFGATGTCVGNPVNLWTSKRVNKSIGSNDYSYSSWTLWSDRWSGVRGRCRLTPNGLRLTSRVPSLSLNLRLGEGVTWWGGEPYDFRFSSLTIQGTRCEMRVAGC